MRESYLQHDSGLARGMPDLVSQDPIASKTEDWEEWLRWDPTSFASSDSPFLSAISHLPSEDDIKSQRKIYEVFDGADAFAVPCMAPDNKENNTANHDSTLASLHNNMSKNEDPLHNSSLSSPHEPNPANKATNTNANIPYNIDDYMVGSYTGHVKDASQYRIDSAVIPQDMHDWTQNNPSDSISQGLYHKTTSTSSDSSLDNSNRLSDAPSSRTSLSITDHTTLQKPADQDKSTHSLSPAVSSHSELNTSRILPDSSTLLTTNISHDSQTSHDSHTSIAQHLSDTSYNVDTSHNVQTTGQSIHGLPKIETPSLTSIWKKRTGRKRKSEYMENDIIPSPATSATCPQKKTSHNVIEKRYRTNLNDKIVELRDSVPSLRAMSRTDGINQDTEDLKGLTPAHKLNKSTIMAKATEYIKHLEKLNKSLDVQVYSLKAQLTKSADSQRNQPNQPTQPIQISNISNSSHNLQKPSLHIPTELLPFKASESLSRLSTAMSGSPMHSPTEMNNSVIETNNGMRSELDNVLLTGQRLENHFTSISPGTQCV